MRAASVLIAMLAGGACLVAGAAAGPVKRAYTTIELKQCKVLPADPGEVEGDPGAAWWCSGRKGTRFFLAEGDLRFMVIYGQKARE